MIFHSLFFSAYSEDSLSQNLTDFVNNVYLQEKTDFQLRQEYDALLPLVSDTYELALTHYYMARAYQSFDNVETCLEHNREMRKGKVDSLFDFYTEKDKAISFYEEALTIIKDNDEKESRWISLEADVISQLCLLKSVGYTIINGPKVQRFAKDALKVDSTNIQAQLLIASSKIYPPAIYFGNPEEALKLLDEIQVEKNYSSENRFNIALGYAYAFGRLDREEEALAKITEALEIYPTNYFALAVKEMIVGGELN